MKIGSLFTGYGGLDMATESFFDAITVWTCDIDPGASKIIAHRYPHAPNLGDITTINWASVEPVDILCGGWPCQPFSLAGKRKGALDERALWPEVTRAVRLLRPRFVVLENVAAIATAGELARAVGDLAALRYDTQWTCLRAADVGAPHSRARIFILATDTAQQRRRPEGRNNGLRAAGLVTEFAADADSFGRQRRRATRDRRNRSENRDLPSANTTSNGWDEGWTLATGLLRRPDAAQCSTGTATDTEGNTWRISIGDHGVTAYTEKPERGGTQPKHLGTPLRPATEPRERVSTTATLTDPDSSRLATDLADIRTRQPHIAWGTYGPAIRRWESVLRRLAPPPTEPSPKGSQRLSPRFVEWMMGLPEGWVTEVPGLTRNSQLKALGNGVVPQQALAALEVMREAA